MSTPQSRNIGAGGDRLPPNDVARDEHRGVESEPRSYTAAEALDATLAPPAAGEMPDQLDEGDPLGDEFGGAHQGATNTNREAHSHREWQGAKTVKANRQILKTGRAE